jgi:hypothetical protein
MHARIAGNTSRIRTKQSATRTPSIFVATLGHAQRYLAAPQHFITRLPGKTMLIHVDIVGKNSCGLAFLRHP